MRKLRLFTAASIIAVISLFTVFQHTSFAKEPALQWLSYNEGQALAKQLKKPILIYFYASWCGYCTKMENDVFPDKTVQQLLRKFILIGVNIDSDNMVVVDGKKMPEGEFARNSGVSGTPTFSFQEFDGNDISQIPGYINLEKFTGILGFISDGSYKKMHFSDYMRRWEQGR